MEQAILVDTFPPSQRSMAMALYGMTTVLAPALGPTLGGVITDHFSWRWIFLINIPIGLLSLVLTARVLSDPPHAGAARDRSRPVDWPGLAFVAVGLGLLEFVLERGHELDWFASPMITKCSLIAGVALVCFVVREWTHDDPVVDLRLLRNRNFAVANLLMMALAFTSFGVTVLMPQYLWALMGYSATDAGLVLSPGGLLIFCLLPIAGRIAPKVDARVLVSFGFLLVGASIFYTARQINTEMDYGAAVRLRMLQCAGFAFLFIPIQMLAYSRIPSHKNNQAASLMNLSRNLGASLGIAFLVGLISHYRQVHQVQLVAHATEYDAGYKAALAQLSDLFQRSGTSPFESSRRALAVVYDEILKQSMQLAYVDALMGLAAVSSVAVVVVWFARLRAPAS
jgi:DHA2 family multidrug resistance protein